MESGFNKFNYLKDEATKGVNKLSDSLSKATKMLGLSNSLSGLH
jgi:hypothetical protein